MDASRLLGQWPFRSAAPWAAVVVAILLAIGAATGCSEGGSSGLEGRVTGLDVFGDVVGYSGARVIVRTGMGEAQVVMVNADEDGHYEVSVEPGDYVVELYTGPYPKVSTGVERVEVLDGRVRTVPTYQAEDYPGGREIGDAAFRRIRRVLRAEVERLALARDSADFLLCGAHAAATEALFGKVDVVADRRVYLAFLEGEPTAPGPGDEETRALRAGGYVALLLAADDLETLARRVSAAPLDTDAACAMFPPSVGVYRVY